MGRFWLMNRLRTNPKSIKQYRHKVAVLQTSKVVLSTEQALSLHQSFLI